MARKDGALEPMKTNSRDQRSQTEEYPQLDQDSEAEEVKFVSAFPGRDKRKKRAKLAGESR
jgi:hypothetical protein